MADFAIGDIQGCYSALQRLLEKTQFNDREDRLWFVGDLVNRGPDSLDVLRFIKQLPIKANITLGNHDLYLLSHIYQTQSRFNNDDTIGKILAADDRFELGDWLRKQSIFIYDPSLNFAMCHAGIPPLFSLEKAQSTAKELENALVDDAFKEFLSNMYGNEPCAWSDDLTNISRLRFICNAFTRMRFCNQNGDLLFNIANHRDKNVFPWFLVPNRKLIPADLVFGHWAQLKGRCPVPNIHAIDTGCFWGGSLTALRLQDKKRFAVKQERSDWDHTS